MKCESQKERDSRACRWRASENSCDATSPCSTLARSAMSYGSRQLRRVGLVRPPSCGLHPRGQTTYRTDNVLRAHARWQHVGGRHDGATLASNHRRATAVAPSDVDLAVTLSKRYADIEEQQRAEQARRRAAWEGGRRFPNITAEVFWPQTEVLLALRRRSRGLSLSEGDTPTRLRAESKIVFEDSRNRRRSKR